MAANPIMQRIRLNGANAATSMILPQAGLIRDIFVNNTTTHILTGGLKFGSTSGAADIYAALAVGASSTNFTTDALLLQRFFGAAQTIFIDTLGAWNSAVVNIDLLYYQL